MKPAAAAILEGMPDPRDLHRVTTGGTTWIFAGPLALFSYAEADAGMRNIAVVTLRQLGYGGQAVAELMGLSENYVATLRNRALRQGTAGVVRQPGARRKLGEAGAGLAPVRDQRRRDRPPARGAPVHGAAPPGPPRHPARTAGRARPGTPAGPPCGGTGV